MLLSVVVPVFNTPECYLREMSRHLIGRLPENTEVVIVDDGSQKSTAELLDSIASVNEAVRVIHQQNGGQNSARKSGVLHATGEYVAFCDADDVLRWDRAQRILHTLAEGKADVVAYNCNLLTEGGREVPGYGFTQLPVQLFGNDNKRLVLAQCAEVWRNIIRRSLLTPDVFACDSNIGEDLAAVFLAISRANVIEVCDETPYLYRVHSGGMENTADAKKRIRILDAFDFIALNLGEQMRLIYRPELEWQAVWHVLYIESAALLKNFSSNKEYLSMFTGWVDKHYPCWRENRYFAYLNAREGLRFRLIVNRRYRSYLLLHKCVGAWRRISQLHRKK